MDIDHLRTWIGRTEEAQDIVTLRLAEEFRATFAPNLMPIGDDEAPACLHWCLTPAIRPMSELGPDGHPKRGGFLPPVALPRRMWAGGEIETLGTIRIGETVTRRSTIEDVTVKAGRTGTLCFVTVRHRYETPRGTAISERHDIVYREAPSGSAATTSAATPGREAQARDAEWLVETSPVFLFRYSAITFNGHRIHYDLPYVTGEEGYSGLVVHGPVQATLLYNLAGTHLGRAPRIFAYRGLAPVTAGSPFRVAIRGEGDGLRAWTERSDGAVGMEAEVRF